jgi:hypothetical protein
VRQMHFHTIKPEASLERARTDNAGRSFIEATHVLERLPVAHAWPTACPGAGSAPRAAVRCLGLERKLEGQDELLAPGHELDLTPRRLVLLGPARDGVARRGGR